MNAAKPSSMDGRIQSGAGKGAWFTRLDWVVDQCRHRLGFEPFPGTLNVHLLDGNQEHVDAFLAHWDAEIVPTDPSFCSARVKRVLVNGIAAAVVLPAEDVRIHEKRVIEILAPCSLKETLGLSDGDVVTVTAA